MVVFGRFNKLSRNIFIPAITCICILLYTYPHKLRRAQFAKNSNNKWVLTEYDSEDAILVLESVEFQIPLRDIYERITLEIIEEEMNELTDEIQE
jgi:hypothetical protein